MTNFKETIKYRFIILDWLVHLRVQSDCGIESQGTVKVFFKECGVQHITSRTYHLQVQGKIERSHGTRKNKLRYDIINCVGGEISFLCFILMKPEIWKGSLIQISHETKEINDLAKFIYKTFIVRNLYN